MLATRQDCPEDFRIFGVFLAFESVNIELSDLLGALKLI